MQQQIDWLVPVALPALAGDEDFVGLDARVIDFWRYAAPDLRTNTVRALLAEFLVARALGERATRVEWDDVELRWEDLAIVVKSAAFLQAWDQRQLSRIVFTGLRGQSWHPRTGYSGVAAHRGDVYVFAVQTSTSHEAYDPLDLRPWRFWVLPKRVLEDLGASSISLTAVRELVEPVELDGLRDAVRWAGGR
ncbi:hypothetical protein FLP10_15570 [Agromyces intestinalis]|uniref:Uncharacterized protein n=1 Tax=Agromyces intestinalis TaxID=2592652 RepID=A0A5C1YKU2_9MICO|nr:hypothetical protein [Agromyces intestinalis]QEO15687.1 hypothetical protein FLP10_15570 [Agromyces intestinalis]